MKQNKKILTFQPAPSSQVKIIRFQLLLFILYLIYLAIPNSILEKFKCILPLRGYLFGDGKFDDLINTIQFGYSNFDLKWILDIKKDLVWPNSPLASFLSNFMKFFVSGPQDAPFFMFCLIAIFIIFILQKINFKFYGWLVICNFPIVFLFSRGNTDILSLFFLVLIVSECLKKRDLMVSIYI